MSEPVSVEMSRTVATYARQAIHDRVMTAYDGSLGGADSWAVEPLQEAERAFNEALGGPSEKEDDRPTKSVETIIVDQNGTEVAFIPGESVWPSVGATVQLGRPNRTATVRDVSLRLFPGQATVFVRVHDQGRGI